MKTSRWLTVCFLLILCRLASAQKPTFNTGVGAILFQKCSSCHREGGGAPFELLTYEQFAKRKKFIGQVVASDYMPPWTADTHYRRFANETALSDSQKELILKWVEAGAPLGPKRQKIPLPDFTAANTLGQADLHLQMAAPYEVPGTGQHHYICYKIPFELPGEAFVKAIEFVPGNKALVHHASYQIFGVGNDVDVFAGPDYYIFKEDSVDRIDDERDFSFFGLYDHLGRPPYSVFHSGYLPGTTIQQYPEGIGFMLPRKGVLLIRSLHYSPTPVNQSDHSSVRLWLANEPIRRTIEFAAFKPRTLGDTIQADSVKSYFINIRTKGEMSLLHINPHMHQLGKSFKAWALTPAGDTIPLIHIPRWDFNWQEFYRYPSMLRIPSGSIIHAEGVFDNTIHNPANPYHPPRPILFETGSMDDTTEMMRLVFLYVPYEPGDEHISLVE